jgi:glycosyltransferase involved in cell wall biosynthesis
MIEVSVVIPTYNSQDSLRDCLGSLTEQTYPANKYEVIVIDDGSTDQSESVFKEVLQNAGPDPQRNFSYFRQRNSGPAVARNLGIQKAKGEVVAFTDSDCVAGTRWIEELAKSMQDPQTLGVSGRTVSPELLIFPWKIAPAGFGSTTCNMAYRKKALDRIGGFDAKFEAPYYEDTDLVLRLSKDGGKIVQSESAVVTHPPRVLGVSGLARQAFLHRYDSLFFKTYPGYVDDFGAPFKPLIWRFSPAGFGALLVLTLFMVGVFFRTFVSLVAPVLLFLAAFLFFVTKGYVLCISCWPGNTDAKGSIDLSAKTRTFFALLLYVPLFLAARIAGSLKYRKFLF